MAYVVDVYNVPDDVDEYQDNGTRLERGWYWERWTEDGEATDSNGPYPSRGNALAAANAQQ